MSISILIIDGKPVSHAAVDDYLDHFHYMLEERGPFSEMDPGYAATIDEIDELRSYFDIHAGIDQTSLDLYDKDGEYLDACILTSTFYIFELDEDVADAVRQYCYDNDIEIIDR